MEENLNENVLLCRMINCEEKFYTLDRNAKFCKDCGHELIDKCPLCGKVFTARDCGAYCIFCGKQIKFGDVLTLSIASDKFPNEPGFKQLKSNSLNLSWNTDVNTQND